MLALSSLRLGQTSELDLNLSLSMREPSFAKEKDFCTERKQEFIGIFNKAFDKHLSLAQSVKRMEPSREEHSLFMDHKPALRQKSEKGYKHRDKRPVFSLAKECLKSLP